MIRRLILVGAVAALALAVMPAAGSAHHPIGTHAEGRLLVPFFPSLFPSFPSLSPTLQLFQARVATARFRSVAAAEAAGYHRAGPCVASPAGGMGIHWEHAALMADDAIDVRHPEILLYEPRPGGGFQLIGLEYWKRDADQNLQTDGDRPSLFGRPFDGPMPGHNPPGTPPGAGMPAHYDLHVWLYKWNPSGLFAPFNPRVHCPGAPG